MKVVIQRVKEASVTIDGSVTGKIEQGLLLLVGFTHDDTHADVEYLVRKVVNLRIFADEDNKMNLSVLDKGFAILSISQFTVYADTRKGNRPSFTNCLDPSIASKLYTEFNNQLAKHNIDVQTGIFGADMAVSLVNDGPVTIIIDSKNK